LKHGSAAGADGLIDKVKLYVNQTVTQSQIDDLNANKDLIVLPAFRNFTNNGFSLEGGGIAIDVTEGNTVPVTNVTDQDSLEVKFVIFSGGGYLSPAKMKIVDKVAPVINSASLVDYQDTAKGDTLTIVFSEPVSSVQVPRPFELYGTSAGINSYFFDVSNVSLTAETGVFKVEGNFTGGVQKVAEGDSIRIEEGMNVVDNATNNQGENNNIRRVIGYNYELNPFVIDIISINPYDINNIDPNNKIPVDIINVIGEDSIGIIFDLDYINGNYYGMIIQVIPDPIDNLDPKFDLEGKIAIYDAVGNQIIGGKAMRKFNNTLIYLWNGRNTNNRKVGRGTYLAVCSITIYPQGRDVSDVRKEEMRIMLGVKG
jgi:hypothetical protein